MNELRGCCALTVLMRSKAPQVYWNDSELVTDHSWGQVLKDASPLSVISLPLSLQLLAVVCSVRCSAYKQLQLRILSLQAC